MILNPRNECIILHLLYLNEPACEQVGILDHSTDGYSSTLLGLRFFKNIFQQLSDFFGKIATNHA